MNYYQHRISHCSEWSHPLLEYGKLLSIGWSDFATTGFITQHQATDWNEITDAIAEAKDDSWKRGTYSLQRFLQMKKGDKVIVPDTGTFHVYEIMSDRYLIPEDLGDLPTSALTNWCDTKAVVSKGKLCVRNSETKEVIDLGFFREVSPVKRSIGRADYADASLTSRMKARQTTLYATDLSKSIEEAISRCRAGQVINLYSQVMSSCAEHVLNIIEKDIKPGQFEKLIRDYFRHIGASAEIPPRKNESGIEGDADVIATFEALKVIIYVQAKRHNKDSETDGWAVQQVEEYIRTKGEMAGDDGYTRIAWVISSAKKFTPECKQGAKSENIRLVNGPEFARMLLDAGIEALERLD